jgi:hypothetical protein
MEEIDGFKWRQALVALDNIITLVMYDVANGRLDPMADGRVMVRLSSFENMCGYSSELHQVLFSRQTKLVRDAVFQQAGLSVVEGTRRDYGHVCLYIADVRAIPPPRIPAVRMTKTPRNMATEIARTDRAATWRRKRRTTRTVASGSGSPRKWFWRVCTSEGVVPDVQRGYPAQEVRCQDGGRACVWFILCCKLCILIEKNVRPESSSRVIAFLLATAKAKNAKQRSPSLQIPPHDSNFAHRAEQCRNNESKSLHACRFMLLLSSPHTMSREPIISAMPFIDFHYMRFPPDPRAK